jgi:phosphoribosylformylglycinamidine synthase II
VSTPAAVYRHLPIRDLDADALVALSKKMKLALFRDDMLAVQAYYRDKGREPTDVELEVIAQTWSEHCKHRIFGARIEHTLNGQPEVVDGLFKSHIKAVSERIFARKPGFVLGAFVDNAGFIALDDELAVCLKVETHNHPSAIEPYAGANTGLGGVIRDILGAGKGAKPIASMDVFCFGPPDTKQESLKAKDVIHPLGIMRGVVRGVRDYGNRMGIPTVNGAIQFDPAYTYNPLVFCGTAGVIPRRDIAKAMRAGLQIVAVGARTGRDGLKGATFSSVSLTADSHAEDQSAVQIGNPIEEKKASDLILNARAEGLIVFLTDCGAGGFSSAAGEMLSEVGGELFLERAPLKEEGLASWQILLSESQERMVLAVEEKDLSRLRELAAMHQTEMTVLGQSDGTGILKIWHHGSLVCELDNARLHEAPRRHLVSNWQGAAGAAPAGQPAVPAAGAEAGVLLRSLLADFAICSREPVIREYDHQVQGNTILTPLAGATGDAPQDAAVMRVDGSPHLVSLACALLPEWGKFDPFRAGLATVDECVRQLVLSGADPDQIAILDNFCMGNPDDPRELGGLVESVKGLCEAAEVYGAPFISGKDSFYNFFMTDEGPVSIPVTALVSGLGIVQDAAHVTGASLRRTDSELFLLGSWKDTPLGGSVAARALGRTGDAVPLTDCAKNFGLYRAYHGALKNGLILSAHDVSEGGLAVALAEMAFSMVAGVEVETDAPLFAEPSGCLVVEVSVAHRDAFVQHFGDLAVELTSLGRTTVEHRRLVIRSGDQMLDEPLDELKSIWKGALGRWY